MDVERITAIHEASGGVPRTINVVCDNALIGGFGYQVKPVSRSIVLEVTREFDLSATTEVPAVVEKDELDGTERALADEISQGYADDSASVTGSQVQGLRRRRSFSFF